MSQIHRNSSFFRLWFELHELNPSIDTNGVVVALCKASRIKANFPIGRLLKRRIWKWQRTKTSKTTTRNFRCQGNDLRYQSCTKGTEAVLLPATADFPVLDVVSHVNASSVSVERLNEKNGGSLWVHLQTWSEYFEFIAENSMNEESSFLYARIQSVLPAWHHSKVQIWLEKKHSATR